MAESKGSRGYILPENVTPEGMICLKVYIPNDMMYLAAFSGAYERLGTWQVWEKDGTNRASQAAQHWKDVIDYTRENGWLNSCQDGQDCEDYIMEQTINIKSGDCGCGGGCGGGSAGQCNNLNLYVPPGGTYNLPVAGDNPGIVIPPGTAPPPVYPGDPTWPSPDAYNQARCDIANYAWHNFDTWFQRIANIEPYLIGAATILAFLTGLPALAAFMARLGAAALGTAVWKLLEMYAVWSWFDEIIADVAQWWRDNKQEIICLAYTALDSNALAAAVQELAIDDLTNEWEGREWYHEAIATGLITAVKAVMPFSPFTLFLNMAIPEGWQSDTSCNCGGGSQLPEDEGYLYLPLGYTTAEELYNPLDGQQIALFGENVYYSTWVGNGQSGGELRVTYDHEGALATQEMGLEDVDIAGVIVVLRSVYNQPSSRWRLRYMAGLNSTEASREVYDVGHGSHWERWVIRRDGVLSMTNVPELLSWVEATEGEGNGVTVGQGGRSYEDGVVNANFGGAAGPYVDIEVYGIYKILE